MTPTTDQLGEIRKRLRGQKAPSTISVEVVGYGAEKSRAQSREGDLTQRRRRKDLTLRRQDAKV